MPQAGQLWGGRVSVVRSLKEKRFVNGGGDSDSSDQGAGALVGVDAFLLTITKFY
jgi:hypothetical protein